MHEVPRPFTPMMPTPVPPMDGQLLEPLRTWVRSHFGISFTADQTHLLSERTRAFCLTQQLDVSVLLTRLLDMDRQLILRFAEAMSTNHTFFFREPEMFGVLANTVLPSMKGMPLRIWSAAASSGEQAHSLSMLLHEQWGAERAAACRILGTDISERQLRTAEAGIYGPLQLNGLGPERLARWMIPMGLGQQRVCDPVRDLCTYRRLNLTQHPWPFEQRFHLILLRNVLYCFEPEVRLRIVEACHDVAEPGAWLITSLTEPLMDVKTRWTSVAPAVFRKGPP